MDDFNPFYLFILIPLSVILVYFSFSTIVLLAVLFVAGLWSCNVVKSPSILKDFKDLASKTKTQGKKVKSIILNTSKFRRKPVNRGPNAIYHSEMPSTVKLTPGPERKPASLKNQSFQANSFSSGSFYERSFDKSLNWSPKQIGNNHSSTTTYRKASTSFLPSVKRALGLSEFSPREIRQTPPPTNFPSPSSAGFIPAVRLSKREKSLVGQPRTSTPRSPNVVRIAPPDPHKLSSPRLFHINTRNENRKPPDTQAVISALREKSLKRSYGGYDLDTSYTDYPVQQAKRRRQDSQQSTSSSSSLPPLPESLPDLASTGYTIPRLETPTLKRTAALDDLEESCSAKKLRKDGRINPILSSLSSSVRIAERDRQIKRKVSPFENKENSESIPKQAKTLDTSKTSLDRFDTVIIPTDEHLKTPAKDTDTPAKEEEVASPGPALPDKPKLEKKITLNQSFSARKRQNSLYSAMNKSFQKVPHANVIASMEDYERDMGAEKKRVQDMLEEIYKEETEKEKEKERKVAEEKAKTLQTSTVKPTVATGVSVPSLAVSSGTSFKLPTSLVPTTATSAQTTASSVTFNFATVKSLSPSKTPVTTSAPPASLTTGGTTATVTSSGFVVSSKPHTTVAPLSSGAPTLGGFNTGGISQTPVLSAPGLGKPTSLSGTSSSVSGAAPFNFGTNSTATTTMSSLAPSPFSFGTNNTATTTTSSAPNFNFGVKPTTQSSGISSQPSTASGVTFSFNSQQAPTTSTQQSTLNFGTQQQNNNPAGQQGTPSFAFGQTAATSSSTQSNPSASTFGFKPFGQNSQNPQSTTTTSSIFRGQPSTGMPSFGNSQSTNTATSGFPAGQGSSMPAFGQGATSTTPAFGQGSTTAPPPYGQGSTSATPAFGQGSTSSTPSFGQGSASAPTAFGQGSTSATPAFGQGSAPGPSFGQGSTSATPAFGQGSAPGPSFGQGSMSTPFGQATATTTASTAGGFNFSTGGSSFGSTAAPNANPFAPSGSFGPSTTKSGFPSFGASTTTTASSGFAFGGTNSTAASGTSFGQPSATPSAGFGGSSFGATSGTTNTGFGSFGTNAPKTTTSGFGSFGQTSSTVKTEASSTTGAFAFGGATPTKPSTNTGFNFSATSAAPSTPSNQTGFNFSASAATPANNAPGGFNFSANASFGTPTGIPTPSFGTPSAGGTPNMFSMGAPNSAPTKPRVALRGRRRPGGRGR